MKIKYEELLGRLGGVHDYGHYALALCPSHSDHSPSLLVYKDGWARCLACNFSGNFTKLLRELEGYIPPVVEKRRGVAHLFPTDLYEIEEMCDTAHDYLLDYTDPYANYLKRRGVFNRIVPQHLGYYNGWYTVPVYDADGKLQGVVGRASPQVQERTGVRFNIPKGQLPLIYIPDWGTVKKAEYLCIVYGIIDALALCEIGVPVGTPTSGKNSLHVDDLEWCRKHIFVIPDKGEENTGRKLVNSLGWRGELIELDYPDGCKDPADVVQCGQGDIIKESIRR